MSQLGSPTISPLLAALEAYADDFVLIGGWVPQLYRDYGGMHWNGKLSLTTEIDAVIRPTLLTGGRPALRSILEGAGLRPRPGTVPGTIWEHIEDGSDALELFTPLLGPIKGAAAASIEQQEGIAAIALPDLDLVTEFIRELHIPFEGRLLRIRVPTLGAYIATKAMTFAARGSTLGPSSVSPKRGKDILYVHDMMSAGPEVRSRIENDLADIAKTKRFIGSLRKGRNHLTLLRGSNPHPAFDDAVAMVMERDGSSAAIASAAIIGSTEDLVDILDGLMGTPRGHHLGGRGKVEG
jgi:hypothetical protein